MKKTESKEMVESRQVVTEFYCDLCGKRPPIRGRSGWETKPDEIVETRIYYETGKAYGMDGADMSVIVFDICPGCFLEKLIPWMKSQGAEPRIEDYNLT